MSYDLFDCMTKWASNASGQAQQEQYVNNSSGNRILRSSTSGPSSSPTTTMTVYTFGLEEHVYSGAGVNQALPTTTAWVGNSSARKMLMALCSI